jgi:hypothetical protein
MSKAAADAFALAAKATRAEFEKKVTANHTKFVKPATAPKPTMADAEALSQHVEKYAEICKYMRRKVAEGMPETWGGTSESEFARARTLVQTLKKLAR